MWARGTGSKSMVEKTTRSSVFPTDAVNQASDATGEPAIIMVCAPWGGFYHLVPGCPGTALNHRMAGQGNGMEHCCGPNSSAARTLKWRGV